MTRATKQMLAYSAIAAALSENERGDSGDPRRLRAAVENSVRELIDGTGFVYRGLSPRTFEPRFETPGGGVVPFDGLPIELRALVAFAVLPTHYLWVAGKGKDPREMEGVMVIDDAELHLSEAMQGELAGRLCRALPKAQWILSTRSPHVAASAGIGSTVALRRLPNSGRVELFEEELAVTH
jgi:predicted ATP-binding protein involved in virulence